MKVEVVLNRSTKADCFSFAYLNSHDVTVTQSQYIKGTKMLLFRKRGKSLVDLGTIGDVVRLAGSSL